MGFEKRLHLCASLHCELHHVAYITKSQEHEPGQLLLLISRKVMTTAMSKDNRHQ